MKLLTFSSLLPFLFLYFSFLKLLLELLMSLLFKFLLFLLLHFHENYFLMSFFLFKFSSASLFLLSLSLFSLDVFFCFLCFDTIRIKVINWSYLFSPTVYKTFSIWKLNIQFSYFILKFFLPLLDQLQSCKILTRLYVFL